MPETVSADRYFRRLGIFLTERFPVGLNAGAALLPVSALFCVWSAIHFPGSAIRPDGVFALAVATSFLFFLFVRICDEFKDREADRLLFPERCLPAGRVRYSDLRPLLAATLALLVGSNLIFGSAPLVFALLMLYGYLMYKYFFFPELFSKNLLLGLLSHNPIVFVMCFYLLALFSRSHALPPLSSENLTIAFAFWMPSIAWETSRKIRAPGTENDYATYSKALGYRAAPLLPLLSLLAQAILFVHFGRKIGLGPGWIALLPAAWLAYFLFIFRFWIHPSAKTARLQPVTEAYLLMTNLFLIVAIVGKNGICEPWNQPPT